MAHFAEIDENNIVLRVSVIPDEEEYRGQEFLAEDLGFGGIWIQTSYNTYGGIHYNPETNEPSVDQSKAYRKNYAGVGYLYDEERDAFIPPKPEEFPSWVLNEFACMWEPPIAKPETEGIWVWNEALAEWQDISDRSIPEFLPPPNE